MRLINHFGEDVIITWHDHAPSCEKCRSVDLEKSATFVHACAQGSQLVMEEMKKRQAPVEKQKRADEEKWAKERGVFIKPRVKDARAITRYVEDEVTPR